MYYCYSVLCGANLVDHLEAASGPKHSGIGSCWCAIYNTAISQGALVFSSLPGTIQDAGYQLNNNSWHRVRLFVGPPTSK